MLPNPEEVVVAAPCTASFKGGPGNHVSGAAYSVVPGFIGRSANQPNQPKREELLLLVL
jgi:hypothetical protein